jgi:hypothetical protein
MVALALGLHVRGRRIRELSTSRVARATFDGQM